MVSDDEGWETVVADPDDWEDVCEDELESDHNVGHASGTFDFGSRKEGDAAAYTVRGADARSHEAHRSVDGWEASEQGTASSVTSFSREEPRRDYFDDDNTSETHDCDDAEGNVISMEEYMERRRTTKTTVASTGRVNDRRHDADGGAGSYWALVMEGDTKAIGDLPSNVYFVCGEVMHLLVCACVCS